jgi:hypothetical protein
MGARVPNTANADPKNMGTKSTKYGSNILLSTHGRFRMSGFSWKAVCSKWGLGFGRLGLQQLFFFEQFFAQKRYI